jgi:hypothetical protein
MPFALSAELLLRVPVMDWNVTIIAPREFRYTHFLFDVARTLAFTIRELGYECSITHNRLEPQRINLLVGVHLIEDTQSVLNLVDSGVPYVVMQTELIHGRNINLESNDRFDRILQPLFDGARAIWDSSPENIAALAELGYEAPLLQFSYQASMQELHLAQRRDVDFFFYGSITEHRRQVLAELRRLGYKVEVHFDEAATFRNAMLERSEVVLTMRQSPQMPHVPQMRLLYLVTNGCLVAGEGGVNQEPVEDLFLWIDPDRGVSDTVEHLRCVRARSDRRELARSFQARLATRPMSELIAPLVNAVSA